MANLKVTDLHEVLQCVYDIGAEVEASLGHSIRKNTDGEKTALNLTDAREKTNQLIMEQKFNWGGKEHKIPIYAKEYRWRVTFGVERGGTFSGGLSIVLKGVTSESEGMAHLERIANELKQIYGLPYSPQTLRNGASYQKK